MSDDFSPFDAPVKEPNTLKTDTSGIKIEKITDAELDGTNKKADIPKDAPVFEIPQFDEIPNIDSNGFTQGDPFAPGSDTKSSKDNGSSSSKSSDEPKVDNAFQKEFSDYTAKWMVDIFFRLVLAAFRQYAKIDKSEVLKAIEQGHIDERFIKFIDEANENVDKAINVTEDEKRFVIEPLKYFLEVKKVQLEPQWMFLVGLLMVLGGVFIKAQEVKKENKSLLDKIIKESYSIKNEMKNNVKKQDEEFYNKRKDVSDYENIENFNFKNDSQFDFTPPQPKEPKIEVVEAEELPNDDDEV